MKPGVLLAIDLPPAHIAALRSRYDLCHETSHAGRLALPELVRAGVRALIGNGSTEVSAAVLEGLPNLGLVCTRGVGHEGVDLGLIRARGIMLCNGAGANADTVADHAVALMLAALRGIPAADALVRSGGWRTTTTLPPIAHRKRLGVLGLGDIGRRIAQRVAGFEMAVAYHSRRRVPGVAWDYAATPLALAARSDILVVVLPGGAATRHMIGGPELAALGPSGLLVNVGRGSVVDTRALIEALHAGRIGAAALDVVEGEPDIPAALLAAPNVTLTPHIAGRSPESSEAGVALLMANLTAFFAGQALLTPVA
ncbi:MAG: 2-hydroxyacid dehydrogenase [Janthinobacterium lividum]